MKARQAWRMKYVKDSGYDCMTDTIDIRNGDRFVCSLNRSDYDNVVTWSKEATTPNEQMVKDAEFIVKACNALEGED